MYFAMENGRLKFTLKTQVTFFKTVVMRKLSILFCLALLTAAGLRSQILIVYPGDANNNGIANHVDLLQLGLQYNVTGPSRNVFPNTVWVGDTAVPWGGPAFLDPGYADCDGNGIVDSLDVNAIVQNFGLTHGGAVGQDSNSFGGTSAPHLQLEIGIDSIFVQGTTQLALNINLGSNIIPVDSIYGFAFTIDFDPGIIDQLSFAFAPNSFALDSGRSLRFVRIDTTLGKIYVAATNIDHVNRMGAGTIATIGMVMDDDIRITGNWNLLFTPSALLAYSASGATIPIFPQADSLQITTGRPAPSIPGLDIYPNPAHDRVSVSSTQFPIKKVLLLDAQGRYLVQNISPNPNLVTLNTDQLPQGCYFLEVHVQDRILRRKLVILPH
jgi:hypothetical protein